jgi:hypothetical protein
LRSARSGRILWAQHLDFPDVSGGIHLERTLGIDNIHAVPLVPDSDDDGLPDDVDPCPYDPLNDVDGDGWCGDVDDCPESDRNPTIGIGYCDSGVGNRDTGGGCTLADRVGEIMETCATGAANDGEFLRCVARALRDFKSSGIISGREYGALLSCAARADGR